MLSKGPFSRRHWQEEIRSRIAEQRVKALLLKRPVVGEGFRQPCLAHRLHRNTIDQAVPLVGGGHDRAGLKIVRENLASVIFCRDATRLRLGSERGVLFVGKTDRQRCSVNTFAFMVPCSILRHSGDLVAPRGRS